MNPIPWDFDFSGCPLLTMLYSYYPAVATKHQVDVPLLSPLYNDKMTVWSASTPIDARGWSCVAINLLRDSSGPRKLHQTFLFRSSSMLALAKIPWNVTKLSHTSFEMVLISCSLQTKTLRSDDGSGDVMLQWHISLHPRPWQPIGNSHFATKFEDSPRFNPLRGTVIPLLPPSEMGAHPQPPPNIKEFLKPPPKWRKFDFPLSTSNSFTSDTPDSPTYSILLTLGPPLATIWNIRNYRPNKGQMGARASLSDDMKQTQTSSMFHTIEGWCESYMGFCKDKRAYRIN